MSLEDEVAEQPASHWGRLDAFPTKWVKIPRYRCGCRLQSQRAKKGIKSHRRSEVIKLNKLVKEAIWNQLALEELEYEGDNDDMFSFAHFADPKSNPNHHATRVKLTYRRLKLASPKISSR